MVGIGVGVGDAVGEEVGDDVGDEINDGFDEGEPDGVDVGCTLAVGVDCPLRVVDVSAIVLRLIVILLFESVYVKLESFAV